MLKEKNWFIEKCSESNGKILVYRHSLALEIRPNKTFYIYNSFKNAFSNAWFSGVEDKSDLLNKRTLAFQKVFREYKTKCGLGNGLTATGLQMCLEIWEHIYNVLEVTKEVIKIEFDFLCKNLSEKFKALN